MRSITIEQLKTVNVDLAKRIEKLAAQLKEENPTIKSSYWIDVEIIDSNIYLSADNGYDVSKSIEVNNTDEEKILELL